MKYRFYLRPGLNPEESFQTDRTGERMSAAKWLDYREQVAPKVQFPIQFPDQVRFILSTICQRKTCSCKQVTNSKTLKRKKVELNKLENYFLIS